MAVRHSRAGALGRDRATRVLELSSAEHGRVSRGPGHAALRCGVDLHVRVSGRLRCDAADGALDVAQPRTALADVRLGHAVAVADQHQRTGDVRFADGSTIRSSAFRLSARAAGAGVHDVRRAVVSSRARADLLPALDAAAVSQRLSHHARLARHSLAGFEYRDRWRDLSAVRAHVWKAMEEAKA